MTRIATLAALLLLAHGSWAETGGHPRDRARTVQGWRVEDVAEDDGGRIVRMTREAEGWHLEFYAAFWHGNDGIIRQVSAIGGECGNIDQLDRHRTPAAGELRDLFTRALTDCGAQSATIQVVLRGLEPAYARAAAWSAEEAEATAAEAARIADYGKTEDE